MRLENIKCPPGSRRNRKRLGQGPGSGTGKTAGKGHKGQRARSGARRGNRVGFTGGSLPLFRHIPKVGFSNHKFKTIYQVVNLRDLEQGTQRGSRARGNGCCRLNRQAIRTAEGPRRRGTESALDGQAHNFHCGNREIAKAGGQVEVI